MECIHINVRWKAVITEQMKRPAQEVPLHVQRKLFAVPVGLLMETLPSMSIKLSGIRAMRQDIGMNVRIVMLEIMLKHILILTRMENVMYAIILYTLIYQTHLRQAMTIIYYFGYVQ